MHFLLSNGKNLVTSFSDIYWLTGKNEIIKRVEMNLSDVREGHEDIDDSSGHQGPSMSS